MSGVIRTSVTPMTHKRGIGHERAGTPRCGSAAAPASVALLAAWACLSPAHGQAPDSPAPQAVSDAPVRFDPAHPLKIGAEFYPAESVKLQEEGKCVVKVVVDASGDLHDPRIATSSGFERLDAACLAAMSAGHMLPAIKNGAPVETTVSMPIQWSLSKHATLADCMAIAPRLPLAAAQAALGQSSTDAKSVKKATTILRLFVAETGAIEGVKVDVSSGYARFDEASIKSVTGQKISPAKSDDLPVAACVTMPIGWVLK